MCTMLAGHRWGPPLLRNTPHRVPSEQRSIPYQPVRKGGGKRKGKSDHGMRGATTLNCSSTISNYVYHAMEFQKGCLFPLLQGGLRLGLGGEAVGGVMGGARAKLWVGLGGGARVVKLWVGLGVELEW